MYTQEEISGIVRQYMASLVFPPRPRELFAPIEYSLEEGGKRLRPTLLLMACNLFSEQPREALPVAAAVEVFHNFTLLHDDIMDNADVRRGKPSVHRRWGANAAILSGDAMMIYAYTLLGQCDPKLLPALLETFNRMAMEVCEGQQYDMDFESREQVSVDEYLNMIRLKTSALLSGSVALGAMIGGADGESLDKLDRFATQLGLAFQLQDDLLDTYGDEKTLGKAIGGDILEGKKTFLMIRALELADPAQQETLKKTAGDASLTTTEKILRVRAVYDRLGIARLTREAIARHTAAAIEALDALRLPEERTAPLHALATGLLERAK